MTSGNFHAALAEIAINMEGTRAFKQQQESERIRAAAKAEAEAREAARRKAERDAMIAAGLDAEGRPNRFAKKAERKRLNRAIREMGLS
jgi:hypothetical protein